ncbi:hypothetical protein F4810DRAFT_416089 [Camillea tinctor]|nr:hypothetical protein F4810DRAFT_416089 [Camillea tinctor]
MPPSSQPHWGTYISSYPPNLASNPPRSQSQSQSQQQHQHQPHWGTYIPSTPPQAQLPPPVPAPRHHQTPPRAYTPTRRHRPSSRAPAPQPNSTCTASAYGSCANTTASSCSGAPASTATDAGASAANNNAGVGSVADASTGPACSGVDGSTTGGAWHRQHQCGGGQYQQLQCSPVGGRGDMKPRRRGPRKKEGEKEGNEKLWDPSRYVSLCSRGEDQEGGEGHRHIPEAVVRSWGQGGGGWEGERGQCPCFACGNRGRLWEGVR